jgi:hypothetical protein
MYHYRLSTNILAAAMSSARSLMRKHFGHLQFLWLRMIGISVSYATESGWSS